MLNLNISPERRARLTENFEKLPVEEKASFPTFESYVAYILTSAIKTGALARLAKKRLGGTDDSAQ